MKTLMMFSGGIDSTAALVKILKETDDEIHVHFIHNQNVNNRADAENLAVDSILPYLGETFRPFKFTNSSSNFSEVGTGFVHDQTLVRFHAAQVCMMIKGIKRVALGKQKDDEKSPLHTSRNKAAHEVFKSVLYYQYATAQNPTIITPIGDWTKKEAIDYLRKYAKPTLAWVHYCRLPILQNGNWKNCDRCITCRAVKASDKELFNRKLYGKT